MTNQGIQQCRFSGAIHACKNDIKLAFFCLCIVCFQRLVFFLQSLAPAPFLNQLAKSVRLQLFYNILYISGQLFVIQLRILLPESQRKSGAFFAILILILEGPFQVFKIDFSARKAKLYLAVVFRVSNFIKQTRPVEVVNRLDPCLQRRSSSNEIIDTAIV